MRNYLTSPAKSKPANAESSAGRRHGFGLGCGVLSPPRDASSGSPRPIAAQRQSHVTAQNSAGRVKGPPQFRAPPGQCGTTDAGLLGVTAGRDRHLSLLGRDAAALRASASDECCALGNSPAEPGGDFVASVDRSAEEDAPCPNAGRPVRARKPVYPAAVDPSHDEMCENVRNDDHFGRAHKKVAEPFGNPEEFDQHASAARRSGVVLTGKTRSELWTPIPSRAVEVAQHRELRLAASGSRYGVRPAAGSRGMQRQSSATDADPMGIPWAMRGCDGAVSVSDPSPGRVGVQLGLTGLTDWTRLKQPARGLGGPHFQHIQAARCRAAISLSVSQPQRPTGHRPGLTAGALNVFQEPPADGDSSPASGRQAAGGNALLWGPAIAHGQSESGKPGWRGSEPS